MPKQSLSTRMYTGAVNKAGDTPFSLACANGHLETVTYFVNEHHCDPISMFMIFWCR